MKKITWPGEVLFRPDRKKYIFKKNQPKGCVFCKALKKGLGEESLLLYKSKHSMVVMNKFPYNNGHLLVLPRKHCGDLLKLSEKEYIDLQKTVRLTFKAINKAYNPKGINLGLNHGQVAGAGIPEHLHYHIIPRWYGDTNFFPVIAQTKVVIETLEESYHKLLPFFKEKAK